MTREDRIRGGDKGGRWLHDKVDEPAHFYRISKELTPWHGSRRDLVVGSSLTMEETSGSSSRTDPLAGRSHIWSMACVGSGSIFMAGSGIELSSIAEDLSCHLRHLDD